MKSIVWPLLGGLLACIAAQAQPVYVYSEFARIDGSGKVTAPERPREILSPAIARNAFSSFQIVIEAPATTSWALHIGQNPENAVTVTMYREKGEELEKVDLPVKGQGTQVFWMDLWTDRNAPTGRIKVEPQLNIDNDWVIYPMEARVEDPVVPDLAWKPIAGGLPARELIRQFLCESGVAVSMLFGEGYSPQGMRYRNGLQDLSLARQGSKAELQKVFGPCGAPAPANPEAYYPVRDFLVKHGLH